MVSVPKKDGTLLFHVDYCPLNAANVGDLYHIPRIDVCIDALGEAHVVSNMDTN